MKPKDYRVRCTKKNLSKCTDVVRTYDKVQTAYAEMLEADESIRSFACNIPLDGLEYTTDFICVNTNGDYMVRECTFRNKLALPRTAKLLDVSRVYWLRRGVTDWAIVIEKV